MPEQHIRDALEVFLKNLLGTIQAGDIYGKGHLLTVKATDNIYAELRELLASRETITIGIVGDEIAFEKEPFYQTSKMIRPFIGRLKELKIEKISFLRDIEKVDLIAFMRLFSRGVSSPAGTGETASSLNIRHILIGKMGYSDNAEEKITAAYNGVTDAAHVYDEGLGLFRKALDDLKEGRAIEGRIARLFIGKILDNLFKNKQSLLILSALREHDQYSFVHSINVATLTLVQAESLGLRKDLLPDIGIAALLHDTGKLDAVGQAIKKNESISEEELEKLRIHPSDGANILMAMGDLTPLAAITAFEHHIRYDGEGYPDRPFGSRPGPISMMIAIADTYDLMRCKRAYQVELPPEEIYEKMMLLSGSCLHPFFLENFFTAIGVYPPGTLVELNDHAIGIVVKESPFDIKRPRVEVLYDSAGKKEEASCLVNLMERESPGGPFKRSILRSIAISDRYEIPSKYLS